LTVAVYLVSGLRSAAGVKVMVLAVFDTVPATGVAPSFKINVEFATLDGLTLLLKVTATTGLTTTVSAWLAGSVSAIDAFIEV